MSEINAECLGYGIKRELGMTGELDSRKRKRIDINRICGRSELAAFFLYEVNVEFRIVGNPDTSFTEA